MTGEHGDNLEEALADALLTAADPIEARLTALEQNRATPRPVDWPVMFAELRAYSPREDLDDWWDEVIVTAIALAIEPLVRRLDELERGPR